MSQKENFKEIKRVLAWILVLNWMVAAAKILLGFVTKSASIMADGFHSFSDGSSNVIGLVGINMASKPRDRDHPYGHGKMENFTSIGIAMMLVILCVELFESAMGRLRNPVYPEINVTSFVVMGVVTCVNYFVTVYEHKKGKELKSDILVADSHHTRSDIYVSLAVMAGMFGTVMGIRFLDPILSLVIVLLIGHMAFDILRNASKVLCDSAIIPPEDIKKVAMGIAGVRDCHEIRTRGREDEILVDLHINVDKSMHVDNAHDLSNRIENAVKGRFQGVREVIVHIEPPGK